MMEVIVRVKNVVLDVWGYIKVIGFVIKLVITRTVIMMMGIAKTVLVAVIRLKITRFAIKIAIMIIAIGMGLTAIV